MDVRTLAFKSEMSSNVDIVVRGYSGNEVWQTKGLKRNKSATCDLSTTTEGQVKEGEEVSIQVGVVGGGSKDYRKFDLHYVKNGATQHFAVRAMRAAWDLVPVKA